jgi:glyoxylase-like metal-dependent hydrolase (beta-lactamase superfamily II)
MIPFKQLKEEVKMSSKVSLVFKDTYLIKEICFCYLLIGESKCLLIDTGIGLFSIKKEVDKLIKGKELIVINTHGHIDHFGNNDEFSEVLVNKRDKGIFELQNGKEFRRIFLNRAPWFYQILGKKLLKPKSFNYKYIDDDYSIDLGNRLIKGIHVPGHTPGSMVFLDVNNRLLFGGDTVVPNLVLLGLDYSLSPQVFLDSMLKVKAIEDQFDLILPGHHSVTSDKSLITDYIEVAKLALKEAGKIEFHDIALNRIHTYGKVKLFCKIEYNDFYFE